MIRLVSMSPLAAEPVGGDLSQIPSAAVIARSRLVALS